MTFAERVRELRKSKGLTTRELGRLAKMKSAAHISLIESGKRIRLESVTTRNLAKALGVSRAHLEAFIDADLAAKEST